jgi:hypothetical protein
VDHWNLIAKLRAPQADRLREWADMEGKSPTMRDDLYRRHALARQSRSFATAPVAISVKFIATVVHAWLSGSR